MRLCAWSRLTSPCREPARPEAPSLPRRGRRTAPAQAEQPWLELLSFPARGVRSCPQSGIHVHTPRSNMKIGERRFKLTWPSSRLSRVFSTKKCHTTTLALSVRLLPSSFSIKHVTGSMVQRTSSNSALRRSRIESRVRARSAPWFFLPMPRGPGCKAVATTRFASPERCPAHLYPLPGPGQLCLMCAAPVTVLVRADVDIAVVLPCRA